MDGAEVVSDVLRAVRLRGAIFFEIQACDPWVAEAPATADFGARVMPGSAHVIEYHVVVDGGCWASMIQDGVAGPPVRLGPGSILVFPHGDRHVMSSAPEMRAEPTMDGYRLPTVEERLPYVFRLGTGEEESARVICGFLGCDAQPFNPLLHALPRQLHVPNGATGWLGSLIDATLAESRSRRLGANSVLTRLSELIFIEVVRRYAETLDPETPGWLGALRAPQVGRALHLMHGEPARDWTLSTLARAAGASRSVLAERFTACVGVPPMTYLQNWRMQIAAGLLAEGSHNLASIAARVGYESEEAFSRAFKRCMGVPPGSQRRKALTVEA